MQVIAELIFKLLLALNLEIQASRVKRVDKLSSGTLNMNILWKHYSMLAWRNWLLNTFSNFKGQQQELHVVH